MSKVLKGKIKNRFSVVVLLNLVGILHGGCSSVGDNREPDRKEVGGADEDSLDNSDHTPESDSTNTSDTASESDPVQPNPNNVFNIWRDAIVALGHSSDNLRERAKDVVQTGDMERIYEFVRDNIRVYPPRIDRLGYSDSVEERYWGDQRQLERPGDDN